MNDALSLLPRKTDQATSLHFKKMQSLLFLKKKWFTNNSYPGIDFKITNAEIYVLLKMYGNFFVFLFTAGYRGRRITKNC